MLMNQVDICLNQLIEAVLESDEYTQYQDMKEKIKQEPEKERAIYNFRRRNYLLQQSKDNIDLFEEIGNLEQEFTRFRQEPLVEDYLSAEQMVCRMIRQIHQQLVERIDFHPEFVD